MDRKQHWDAAYTNRNVCAAGWHQPHPELSLKLILEVLPASGRVIDVGGGASVLVDRLLEHGVKKVAVLDISSAALQTNKARMGDQASQVEWIVADVTTVNTLGEFDVWHDRAMFHFLTSAQDRQKYAELAARTIPVGGHLVISAFAKDGPAKCSGLDVCRYDGRELCQELGAAFKLIRETHETHVTPTGAVQPFAFCLFERV